MDNHSYHNILSLSIYLNESLIGIIMAISGVICVVLTGKGKLSSYVFGMVNTLLYAYIAYGAKYYGDVMLNLLYYAPMNVVGWVMWNKHMSVETKEVEKKRMKNSEIIVVFLGSALGIFLYGLILKKSEEVCHCRCFDHSAFYCGTDSVCKRYMEQWVIWIIIDVASVYMWAMALLMGEKALQR